MGCLLGLMEDSGCLGGWESQDLLMVLLRLNCLGLGCATVSRGLAMGQLQGLEMGLDCQGWAMGSQGWGFQDWGMESRGLAKVLLRLVMDCLLSLGMES